MENHRISSELAGNVAESPKEFFVLHLVDTFEIVTVETVITVLQSPLTFIDPPQSIKLGWEDRTSIVFGFS
jgi:hypothetical protein